ncbi:MAG: ABC transporter ATP-binding protein [Mycoplasmatales bacterium]
MDNNKKSVMASINYVLSFMIKHWIGLFFVIVFILSTTYLQVIGPKLMGNSIDSLVTYVTKEITVQKETKILENLKSGNGLTEEEKNLLAKSGIEQSVVDFFKTATPAEQQKFYEQNLTIIKILKADASVADNKGLTVEQKQQIQMSEIAPQTKQRLLKMTSEELVKTEKSLEIFDGVDTNLDTEFANFTDSIMILVEVYIGLFLCNFLYMLVMTSVSGRTTQDMRMSLFKKMSDLSIRFFDQAEDGDLLSRFINDIDNISNALNQSITQSLSQIAMLIGIVYMMFSEDTSEAVIWGINIPNVMSLQILIFAIVAIIASSFVVKSAQKYVAVQQEKLGKLNAYIDERTNGQKIVKSYDLQAETFSKYFELNEDLKETSIKGQIYSGILMPLMNGFGLVNLGMLVFVGSIFVSNGLISVGILVMFIQYSQRFFQPLAQVVSQYNMIQLGITGAGRIKEVVDVEKEIIEKEDAIEISGINGFVELENVSFHYDPEREILKNLNISVQKGQMIALVGPTGSGKTTVMNLMNRFYDVTAGSIKFDGRDIRNLKIDSLRKNVGIVLQESVLFSGTIFENIAYGKPDATIDEVIAAAKATHIHDFIMELEHGYETKIDNTNNGFSTGQKQLMSMARTIITDPDLLILDEATSNVDTVTEAKIQKAVNEILKGRTSFVIAHRLKTILDADVIVVLKDGEIIEQGNHEQLLKLNGFYAELYNNQFVN